MAQERGTAFYVHFTAWDISTLSRKGGDASNMTAYIIRDNGSPQIANNSIEETPVT